MGLGCDENIGDGRVVRWGNVFGDLPRFDLGLTELLFRIQGDVCRVETIV